MMTLFLLLGSLLLLPPLAQAKDQDVIQKTDILFKTETKDSSKTKKSTTLNTTQPQAVAPTQAKEATPKAKPPAAITPSKGTVPSPSPSGTVVRQSEPVKGTTSVNKEGPSGKKTPSPSPAPLATKPEESHSPGKGQTETPTPSPLAAKPAEGTSPEKAQTDIPTLPVEPKKEVSAIPSTLVVPVSVTAGQSSLQEVLQQAYECLQKDKKYEARNLYSQALFLESSEERRQLIRKHLDELNNSLLFSTTPNPDFVSYKVQPGDNLTKIAKQYNTTAELIMRLNRKSSPMLRVGELLRILKGKTTLLVDKSDFTLTLLLDGHYLKQYPIGIGRNDKTPEGKFVVEIKQKEPTWFSPIDSNVYPYGHPQNILGTRWMGFQEQPGLRGFGIHGTTEPDSIGTESSNGCVRMFNQDVEELYDYVTPGTEVVIQR
jgi:lipoprotein-anchoring transpeptidase ErfK/SrfK